MELQHTFTVPVGVDAAWAAFTDIERIAPCLPGAVITSVDGDDFEGTAKVKLGPISLTYSGKGSWVSRDDATYSAVIDAQGKDERGNGTAGATIRAHLEPDGDSTRVVVDTDLKITGRPAQFGRGVIQDVGGKILDQFAACLSERLAEPAADAEPTEPTPDASPPAPSPPHPPQPAQSAPPPQPTQLDLGGVVLPTVLRRAAPAAVAAAVVALVIWLVKRR